MNGTKEAPESPSGETQAPSSPSQGARAVRVYDLTLFFELIEGHCEPKNLDADKFLESVIKKQSPARWRQGTQKPNKASLSVLRTALDLTADEADELRDAAGSVSERQWVRDQFQM